MSFAERFAKNTRAVFIEALQPEQRRNGYRDCGKDCARAQDSARD